MSDERLPLPDGLVERDGAITLPRRVSHLLAMLALVGVGGFAMSLVLGPWLWIVLLLVAVFAPLEFASTHTVLDERGIRRESWFSWARWSVDWADVRDARESGFGLELARVEGEPVRLPLWTLTPEARAWLVAEVQRRFPEADAVARMPGERSADGVEISTGVSARTRNQSAVWIVVFLVVVGVGASVGVEVTSVSPVPLALAALAMVGWWLRRGMGFFWFPDAIRVGARDLALLENGRMRRRIPFFEIDAVTHQRALNRVVVRLKSGEKVRIQLSPDAVSSDDAAWVARALDDAAHDASDDSESVAAVDPRLIELARRVRRSER